MNCKEYNSKNSLISLQRAQLMLTIGLLQVPQVITIGWLKEDFYKNTFYWLQFILCICLFIMNWDTKSSILGIIFVLFRWNPTHRNCPQYWPTSSFAAIIFWWTAVTNCVESSPRAVGAVGTSFTSLLFTSWKIIKFKS